MFFPPGGGATMFKFPEERKLRIEGCATKEDLANPVEFDGEGQRCLIVGKDGNTTDLTVGCYAGLVSLTLNEVCIESVELGIYNSGVKSAEAFSAKGDSGSLVWHTRNGQAYIVGQLHSGNKRGGSTSKPMLIRERVDKTPSALLRPALTGIPRLNKTDIETDTPRFIRCASPISFPLPSPLVYVRIPTLERQHTELGEDNTGGRGAGATPMLRPEKSGEAQRCFRTAVSYRHD